MKKKRRFSWFEIFVAAAIFLTLVLVGIRVVRLYQTDRPAVLSAMTVSDWCFAVAALLAFIGIPMLRKRIE